MFNAKINIIKVFLVVICLLQLLYLLNSRSGFQYEIFKNPLNENSGLYYALSPEIIESKKILKNQKVNHFNLSEELRKKSYFFQRTIEFNYPIRMLDKSKMFLFESKEELPSSCKLMESGQYLKLAEC